MLQAILLIIVALFGRGLRDHNVAVRDSMFAGRLEGDFQRDMAEAREVSYEQWKRRGLFERGPELLG